MDTGITVGRRRSPFRRVVAFAIVYAVVTLPLRWAFSSVPFVDGNPEGATLVIGSLLLGPAAALGGALGAVLTDLFAGGPSLRTVCRLPAVGVAALSACTIWRAFGAQRASSNWGLLEGARAFAVYALVATVAVAVYATTFAWALELSSRASFSLAGPSQVRRMLPLAIAAFPVWLVLERRVGLQAWPTADAGAPVDDWGRYRRLLFVATPVAWLVLGTTVSYAFRATELVPAERIGRRLTPVVTTLLDLAGPQGTRVQILGGLAALLVLSWLLRDAYGRGTY